MAKYKCLYSANREIKKLRNDIEDLQNQNCKLTPLVDYKNLVEEIYAAYKTTAAHTSDFIGPIRRFTNLIDAILEKSRLRQRTVSSLSHEIRVNQSQLEESDKKSAAEIQRLKFALADVMLEKVEGK